MNSLNKILENVKEKIKLSSKEQQEIDKAVKVFIKKLENKKFKILIGGSYAKKTLIKKRVYDVDIFAVFSKTKDPSKELENVLKKLKLKFDVLKGSRNYFQIKINEKVIIELVPTVQVDNPDDAENITDVSFFHVGYILKNIKKNPKLADEIKLAKSFCFANNCYGAESYVQGFSGYALETLVSYYRSFLNFIKAASKWKDKEVLDPEKKYKNKQEILDNLNWAKIISPLIIVDPTHVHRNITAAISKETYHKFIRSCKGFLKKPSEDFFFKQQLDLNSWKKQAKNDKKFFLIKTSANSDKLDVAGAKLRKFFNFLTNKAKSEGFSVIKEHFDFNESTLEGLFFLIVKEPSSKITISGPPIKLGDKFVNSFKKKWKKTFIKNQRIYAETSRNTSFENFIKNLDKYQLKEMKIRDLKILK